MVIEGVGAVGEIAEQGERAAQVKTTGDGCEKNVRGLRKCLPLGYWAGRWGRDEMFCTAWSRADHQA